jgi:hypothetical protein
MATKSILTDEFVSAEDINVAAIQCPRESCHSNTLMLYGTAQITRTEVMENGQVTDVRLEEETHAFEIDQIECLKCNTRWHLKTREVIALEQRNEILREIIIRETGKDPYGMGPVN